MKPISKTLYHQHITSFKIWKSIFKYFKIDLDNIQKKKKRLLTLSIIYFKIHV
ncbi:hypothetical protein B4125_2930 [Bacillus paralicheniformis]|nr:hypothetical protein SC10_B2orf05773 [Bacillus paralicheniformis]OLG04858.1 hypothetical protein B4125_2930 [Bacillus paralicheniformis]TWJ61396.1 hypothetical protein CHCC5021_4144 [Bacillus paralicheniformis]TWL11047.1 hypothetical protein CHCC19468_1881 [Bacillus paralicheniformis]TWL18522.1 hypothetical protein CHCC19467_0938 [Bacillus paralicheniformis]